VNIKVHSISVIATKLILTSWLLACSSPIYAIDFLSTKGVSKTGKDNYKIVTADPHFVIAIDGLENSSTKNRTLSLPIEVKRQPGMQQTVQIVLFFAPINLGEEHTFDPLHRLTFIMPDRKAKEILIPLPDELSLPGSTIRLDIDNCQSCDVKFNGNLRYLRSFNREANQDLFKVEEYRLINGTKPIPKEGLSLDVISWKPHAIDMSGKQVNVIDNDPFLVSEALDFDTEELGGIKIKLIPPQTKSNIHSFQLFYGTERHIFIERASAILKVAADKTEPSKAIEFIVPLDFLSSRFPPDRLLTRLRLDFPEKQSKENELWAIQSVDLITKQQLPEYRNLIPSQLVHFKFQKASKRQIIKGIFNKITSDLGFTIFYLWLLISCILVSLWLFRKTSKNS